MLREEGHEDLPKTAQQLLGTKHCQPMKTVLSKRDTTAHYLYIEIKKKSSKNNCSKYLLRKNNHSSASH